MNTPPVRPRVDCEHQHPALAVRDVAAAIAFYVERLGFEHGFTWGDPPTFGGVDLGLVRLFLRQSEPCPDGCSVFFFVGDADELFAYHRGMGVEVVAEIDDRPWSVRDYTVRDLEGHLLTFGHPIFTMGPAIEIERVDVPVRLERRLAGLLTDLAAHKRMTVSECLEETLLHTFERAGEGVASPHTSRTFHLIEELKDRHGIDYDTHGSYRFVERGIADVNGEETGR